MAYGPELILDLHHCNVNKFNRRELRRYFIMLCEAIDMERCKLVFWDDRWTWLWKLLYFWDKSIHSANEPHTKGTTAVQFILTSNVTIHTLDLMEAVHVNIFSCKDFDQDIAAELTENFFDGVIAGRHFIDRR